MRSILIFAIASTRSYRFGELYKFISIRLAVPIVAKNTDHSPGKLSGIVSFRDAEEVEVFYIQPVILL